MEFNKLFEEVRAIEPGVTPKVLSDYLTAQGVTAADIGTDGILTIAEALAPKTVSLTTVKGGLDKSATDKATKKGREKRQSEPGLLSTASVEMDSFEDAVTGKIDRYVETRGDRIAETILSAPGKLIDRVYRHLEESNADPAGFRDEGERLACQLFGDL